MLAFEDMALPHTPKPYGPGVKCESRKPSKCPDPRANRITKKGEVAHAADPPSFGAIGKNPSHHDTSSSLGLAAQTASPATSAGDHPRSLATGQSGSSHTVSFAPHLPQRPEILDGK
jgi:hypothetical protein